MSAVFMALTTVRLKTLVLVLKIDNLSLNQSFTIAHIVIVVVYAALLIWYPFIPNTQWLLHYALVITVTILNGLMDIVIPCLICNIIYESSKVRLTNDWDGNVRFNISSLDSGDTSSSSEEEQVIERDQELEEWLSDDKARRDSFERKMDARTARDSLVRRDAEWIVAGRMT